MTLPNYLIIGTQRGATTWLHAALSSHPEVCVAPMKQVHFFDRDWDRGVEWYESLFQPKPGQRAIGEATPGYMFYPEAVPRMASVVPGARLIAILRNPIDRAYSAYWLRRERYGDTDFGDAVALAMRSEDDLLSRSLYAEQLKRVLEYYPREQLLVLFFDDLKRDAQAFTRQAFEFLGIDPDFTPLEIDRTVNAAAFVRLEKMMRRLRLRWLGALMKKLGVARLARRVQRSSGKAIYRPMDEAVRQRLRAFFEKPNRELEDLLGIQLDWA